MTEHAPGAIDALATEVAFTPFAFVGGAMTFALMGAVSSIYGPLLVAFSHSFHLSISTAGEVLSVHFVGALIGVLLAWRGVQRKSGRVILSSSMLVLALGALGAASAKHWPLFLSFVFLIGVGFGGLDFSLNTLLARSALVGRARRLSVANGGYGVGAVLGPLVVIALRPHHFALLLLGIGALAVLLSTLTRGVHAPALGDATRRTRPHGAPGNRRTILVTFIVAYVLYIAVETSSSGWMATQIHREGFTQSLASLITALFWTMFAVARFAAGPLHRRFDEQQLVLGGLVLAVAVVLVALSRDGALVAYPLLGLVLASVFPMGLVWYTVLVPHDNDGLALMILFMMAGGVVGPGLVSVVVSVVGVHAVPLVIAAFALADIAVFTSALRFHSPGTAVEPPNYVA